MLLQETKIKCVYCTQKIFPHSVTRHESACYLNPKLLRECAVCSKPVKNWKNGTTCSHSCANKFFRTGENHGRWKPEVYRSTCFLHHKKECVVCGEDKIVEVHHLDHNKENNDPSNLIPLCPTHHQYWHSQYKSLVELIVLEYIKVWKLQKYLR